MKPYFIDWPTLRGDLMQAYLDARLHKRNRRYQLEFESNLDNNLDRLCDELYYRTYKPSPSDCFIITDPKKREVFAAAFRDRIVHHLYYNYVHQMFERTFINDSYSCIKGRGTHYGINRLEHHIRCESQNYTETCYVLKMDIRGYFMHIDRERLLNISLESLKRMSYHQKLYPRRMPRSAISMAGYLARSASILFFMSVGFSLQVSGEIHLLV